MNCACRAVPCHACAVSCRACAMHACVHVRVCASAYTLAFCEQHVPCLRGVILSHAVPSAPLLRTYIVMASIVMAYIVVAYVVMAYAAMAVAPGPSSSRCLGRRHPCSCSSFRCLCLSVQRASPYQPTRFLRLFVQATATFDEGPRAKTAKRIRAHGQYPDARCA